MRLLTRGQVRRLDAIAIEELGIPGIVLMENAGRGAAETILRLCEEPAITRAVILCGAGNNGGDGFVIARHLMNAGRQVIVLLAVSEDAIRGDALVNYRILRNMGVAASEIREQAGILVPAIRADDLVVDALLGTGFQGQVREPLAKLISAINAAPQSLTVAIDVPSGMNCDTGEPGGQAIRADLTITFAAPKLGFSNPRSVQWTGPVRIVDIGTPPALVDRVLANADIGVRNAE